MTDNTDALPPLPASQAFSLTRSVYTADDMHAYARAALASRDAEIAKLRQGEPAAEIKWAAGIVGSIMEVRLYDYELPVGTKLYASPPPAQPQQAERLEPCCGIPNECSGSGPCQRRADWALGVRQGSKIGIGAQPPREPVQPLSEDEIFLLTGHCGVSQGMAISIARTIEAAHGITERMSAGGTK